MRRSQSGPHGLHSRRHTGVDVLEKSVSSLESAAVRLGSSDIRIISDTVPVLFLLYLLGRARFGANGVAGERKREGADGAAGGAARAPDELETREAEAGMRNGRRDHEGPRVEHGAGAKRAPLTLG